jgi:trk system potassium uptake protein
LTIPRKKSFWGKMMQKDILVIGLGIFGYETALRLQEVGMNVLAMDINEDLVHHIKDHVTGAVIASVTDEEALAELEPSKFDNIVLGLGRNFENMILGTAYLKRLGAKHIIAKANTETQQEILLKIGADEVILPEKQAGERLAERLARPNITQILEIDGEIKLAEIKVDRRFADKTLRELDLRRKHNVTAIILKRTGYQPRIITDPELRLLFDDKVVVLGSQDDIQKTFS